MTWRTAFAVLMFLAPAAETAAGEPVEGAFGLEFGQVLDITGRPAPEVDDDGGLRFALRPEHPYGPLSEYTVTVTPESHKVYMIQGIGHFSSMRRCREELITLEGVLEKKYVKTSGEVSERFGDIPEIRFGKTSGKIYGFCGGGILNKRLVLSYIDQSLVDEARRESRRGGKVEQGGRDTGGL